MEAKIAPPEVVDEIFYKVDVLLRFHEAFLETLVSRTSHWHADQQIGDLFLREVRCDLLANIQTDFLVCYAEYINNYRGAILALRSRSKEPEFSGFIKV